jgi:hypothetical protein
LTLNLNKQALTLAGGFLLIQTLALAAFMWQIESVESSSAESLRSVFAIEKSNWLAATLSATTLACFAYRVTGDDQCFHIYERGRNELREDMNALSPAFNDNADQRDEADHAMRLIISLVGVLEETSKEQPLPHNEQLIQLVRLELLPGWNELYKLHDQLVAEQETKVREGPQHAQTARKMDLLYLAIFELLAAAGLAYAINYLLERNRQSLQQPARDASSQPASEQPSALAPKIEPEVAKGAEKMFRVVTDTTSGSSDLRLHEMERLNKDMRASLASVQDALESVIEDHEDDLPPPAQRKLNDAHSNVAKILKQIHDLGPQK